VGNNDVARPQTQAGQGAHWQCSYSLILHNVSLKMFSTSNSPLTALTRECVILVSISCLSSCYRKMLQNLWLQSPVRCGREEREGAQPTTKMQKSPPFPLMVKTPGSPAFFCRGKAVFSVQGKRNQYFEIIRLWQDAVVASGQWPKVTNSPVELGRRWRIVSSKYAYSYLLSHGCGNAIESSAWDPGHWGHHLPRHRCSRARV
jgi:hypothetical protein